MLGFVRRNFRMFAEVILWLVLIICVIAGGNLGDSLGKSCSYYGGCSGGQPLLGAFLGLAVGVIIDVVVGGLIATFVEIGENIEIIKNKIKNSSSDSATTSLTPPTSVTARVMNMGEAKKKKFKRIVKGVALVFCLLRFGPFLVQGSFVYFITTHPLFVIPAVIPAVLLILAFTNKSFVVLRNVSIAGLIAEIIFLIGFPMPSGGIAASIIIYAGLIGFMQYCVKQEGTTEE